jgi:peptidoglycan/LPS O-acetylase OafA/YrhL
VVARCEGNDVDVTPPATTTTTSTTGTSALAGYEPSLDGLRGLCIAAVVTYHACAVSDLSGWVRVGFIGVSVFFRLSGFLITSLLLREHESTGRVRLTNFWARRIRRLWPAALVVVLAVILFSAWGPLSAQPSDTIAATWSVTNWHVIAGGDSQLLRTIVGPLGPTWSLAVEEQFYVVLALLFVAVHRLRRMRVVLAAVAAAGVVLPALLTNLTTDWHPTLEFSTLLRVPELFVGVLLALWHGSDRWPTFTRRTADAMAGIGLAAMLALFLFVDYSPPWLLRGGYTVVALVTAVTITGLLGHGTVAGAVGASPLRWLGVISYSLYLVHWPVDSLLTSDRLGFDGTGQLVVLVAVAIAAAWLLHVAVERPVRRLPATNPLSTPAATIGAALGAAAALTLLAVLAL